MIDLESEVFEWLSFAAWSSVHTLATTEAPHFRLWLTLTKRQSRLEAGAPPLWAVTYCHVGSRNVALTEFHRPPVGEALAEWVRQLQIFGQGLRRRSPSRETTTPSTLST